MFCLVVYVYCCVCEMYRWTDTHLKLAPPQSTHQPTHTHIYIYIYIYIFIHRLTQTDTHLLNNTGLALAGHLAAAGEERLRAVARLGGDRPDGVAREQAGLRQGYGVNVDVCMYGDVDGYVCMGVCICIYLCYVDVHPYTNTYPYNRRLRLLRVLHALGALLRAGLLRDDLPVLHPPQGMICIYICVCVCIQIVYVAIIYIPARPKPLSKNAHHISISRRHQPTIPILHIHTTTTPHKTQGKGTFNDDFHTFGLYWDEVRGSSFIGSIDPTTVINRCPCHFFLACVDWLIHPHVPSRSLWID